MDPKLSLLVGCTLGAIFIFIAILIAIFMIISFRFCCCNEQSDKGCFYYGNIQQSQVDENIHYESKNAVNGWTEMPTLKIVRLDEDQVTTNIKKTENENNSYSSRIKLIQTNSNDGVTNSQQHGDKVLEKRVAKNKHVSVYGLLHSLNATFRKNTR
ncbi:hypothetical protein HELRODRAFT_164247 [Helobdella robusta]|uniref:Uncharacterized protein n=1 Tax=Helobdella robusta TaxID=6412 RepID=T1EV57_HELRO|nr:hypothetical protein HELRODRAFT_164247 [Helobdella robusta]ESN94410.1 hypothetical protein HELRODRAFT_164247 [Helobdella robusta]